MEVRRLFARWRGSHDTDRSGYDTRTDSTGREETPYSVLQKIQLTDDTGLTGYDIYMLNYYGGDYTVNVVRYPVVTICGSMRYFEDMLEVAHRWTADGWIVLMPFVIKGGQEGDEALGTMLDDMHRRKIDLSDRVIVYGEHIGESVTAEIVYAVNHNKPIDRIMVVAS